MASFCSLQTAKISFPSSAVVIYLDFVSPSIFQEDVGKDVNFTNYETYSYGVISSGGMYNELG